MQSFSGLRAACKRRYIAKVALLLRPVRIMRKKYKSGGDMNFNELLELVTPQSTQVGRRICADSRLLKKGDVFVAVKGSTLDGHKFINDAVANGAEYVVVQNSQSGYETSDAKCRVIVVEDSARAYGLLVQASRGNPSAKLTNLAVTGTNGKTTVAFLVRSVIEQAGQKCGLIGTVVYETGSSSIEAHMTTPDAGFIARMSLEMLESGSKYMMIEASSHALAQNRLAGVEFKAAAFTNLSGEHLDYHQTMDDYLAAKMKLFQELSADATAVLNKQSPQAEQIAHNTKASTLWYAVDEEADISARIESMDISGTVFILEHKGQKQKIKTALPGRHNVSNHLAAAGLCLAVGFDSQRVAAGLGKLEVVPGRLERVECGRGFHIFIDYAHTDDALKNVLATLKPLCRGKLTVVFGCGGDRDRSKRPRMAKVAEQLADSIIVTSDNPRTEKPEEIINEIVAGFSRGTSVTIEADRRKAIELAIKNAEKNDIVLIAGKGHEKYQIIDSKKIEFSDRKVAEECLQKVNLKQ
jgi:UDP-N-acetylmuramoyl-L-alanyl-D-glutamate--2,6-diaminopimelate ligase